MSSRRGAAIVVVAILSIVAVLVSETAAVVVSIVTVTATTVGALALSSRRRPGPPAKSPSPKRAIHVDRTETEPRLAFARAHLSEIAGRLELDDAWEESGASVNAGFEPLVSVVVPCHNDARFVEDSLESLKRQVYQRWECVVVDDASTDESWELIEKSIDGDDRFRAIRLESNVGSGAARNRGIDQARGQYLAFLDADDLLLGESLSDRVSAIAASSGDPLVVGSFCAMRSGPEDISLESVPARRNVTQPEFIDFVTAGAECPFTIHAPLVAMEAIRSLGGFDESMTTGAVDWDLWYRLLRNGHILVPTGTLGAIYRQKPGGITRANTSGHTTASAALIRAAFEPVDPSIMLFPTSFPMPQPLGFYESCLVVAERAVRFASMALADEDPIGMREALTVLDEATWPLLDRHLDWAAVVGRGVARAHGLQPRHVTELGDSLRPFVSAVRSAAREASQ